MFFIDNLVQVLRGEGDRYSEVNGEDFLLMPGDVEPRRVSAGMLVHWQGMLRILTSRELADRVLHEAPEAVQEHAMALARRRTEESFAN